MSSPRGMAKARDGRPTEAERKLAEWRREGHGVWYITYVADGFDDEFTYLLPGRLKEKAAKDVGRTMASLDLGIHRKFIYFSKIKKET